MKSIPIRHLSGSRKEPAFTTGFAIRSVQDLLAGQDMVQELHRHDFYYVLALQKGTGKHEVDFVSYNIGDHSIFFLRPGQVHRIILKAGSVGYLMQFGLDFYPPKDQSALPLLRRAGALTHCRPEAVSFDKLNLLLAYMLREFTEKQENYQEVVKATLEIFLIELVRNRQCGEALSQTGSQYAQERLEEFLELLEAHITHHQQVSEYADQLHLSVYQLNSITKATLGKTCSRLISEQIILEAKRYLLATSSHIYQVAYHLGYEDVSYFIRFFKKHTGYSPEAFRQNFR